MRIVASDTVDDTAAADDTVAPGASASVATVTVMVTAGPAALVPRDGTAVVVAVSTAALPRSPSDPSACSAATSVPSKTTKALTPTVVLTTHHHHHSPFSTFLGAPAVNIHHLLLLLLPSRHTSTTVVAAVAGTDTDTPAVLTPRLPLPQVVTSPPAKDPSTSAA